MYIIFLALCTWIQVACGRRPLDTSWPEDQAVLVDWVWNLHQNDNIMQAADPRSVNQSLPLSPILGRPKRSVEMDHNPNYGNLPKLKIAVWIISIIFKLSPGFELVH